MHNHHHKQDEVIPIAQWRERRRHLSDEDVNKIRMFQWWEEDRWLPFPDAGSYQPTRMTSEFSKGTCSAIWLKLEPDEGFDPHRHPNAIHTMIVYEGEADLFWEDESKVYSTTMQVGKPPYAVLSTMPHAIVANRGVRVVMIVINTPPDDINRPEYALPISQSRPYSVRSTER